MVLNTIRIFDRVQKLSCENIMLQSYHLVLQKCENLKYHLHRPLAKIRFPMLKYHCEVQVNETTRFQVPSINFTNISEQVYSFFTQNNDGRSYLALFQ